MAFSATICLIASLDQLRHRIAGPRLAECCEVIDRVPGIVSNSIPSRMSKNRPPEYGLVSSIATPAERRWKGSCSPIADARPSGFGDRSVQTGQCGRHPE
jgi:hypothetical protein